jgi:heavy metal sensor kinase
VTPLSIRARLTLWYSAVLALTFILFSFIAWYAMRRSIYTAVDDELHESVESIRDAIQEFPPGEQAELRDKLEELGRERAAGDFMQAETGDGSWTYRSGAMARLNLPFGGDGNSVFDWRHDGVHLRLQGASVEASGRSYLILVGTRMTDYDAALKRLESILLVAVPVLLLFASLMGYWLSRRALAPVEEITVAAREIGASNLSRRLTVPRTGDELQNLSETLNNMLDRLEKAFQRITQFTADASHELRTPVSVMRARTELALRRPRSDEEYRETLALVLRELERTTELLENLLSLARADSGGVNIAHEPLDLRDVAREAAEEARPLAEAKQIHFAEDFPATALAVVGDAAALRRLLLILLDNAVKYTPAAGAVSFSLSSQDGNAIATVKDSGVGIGPDDLPHIFERFYRADKARSRAAGGAGLGLSIARWIAESHGGAIRVQSAFGQGSEFRVEIPLESAHS